jgi:hypothetical protein
MLIPGEEATLVQGPHFELIAGNGDVLLGRRRWIMPLGGKVWSARDTATAGECLLVAPQERVESHDARMLVGAMA